MVPLVAFVYAVGSLVCHQLPERSFHVAGYQLPVCARCVGIYAAFAIVAALLAFSIGVRSLAASRGLTPLGRLGSDPVGMRLVAGVGVMPTVVTVALEWAGLWQTSNAVRFAAGLPLGAAVAAIVMATLHYDRCARRPPIRSPRPPSVI